MSEMVEISTPGQASRSADVIFVHGLAGDARATWRGQGNAFWPKWLANDLPSVGVWSLGYESAVLKWGHSMAIRDRAINALAQLEANDLGKNPTVFVCHSLGGLSK
jgi:protein SERAC1